MCQLPYPQLCHNCRFFTITFVTSKLRSTGCSSVYGPVYRQTTWSRGQDSRCGSQDKDTAVCHWLQLECPPCPRTAASSCLIQSEKSCWTSGLKSTAKFSFWLALRHRSGVLTCNSGLRPISAVNCANLHGTVLPVLTTGNDYDVLTFWRRFFLNFRTSCI